MRLGKVWLCRTYIAGVTLPINSIGCKYPFSEKHTRFARQPRTFPVDHRILHFDEKLGFTGVVRRRFSYIRPCGVEPLFIEDHTCFTAPTSNISPLLSRGPTSWLLPPDGSFVLEVSKFAYIYIPSRR